ncbi:MAG: UDP-N-acetylmuramoyl-tripeptide--D-alanyl-D-alanine ligase [Holophagales bacterium]|jgi:UDP-N-acetylmuramoyl-tripeptide--D-alanyl-D-alanine ligase|nr:UDP-N-acetylmuramoyl-tripeptide--D-alanyl-D-alanine ligase [Holophagales bacterium]
MFYSLAQLSAILNAELIGDGSVVPSGVSLDSRTIGDGDCFVALKGERDGHEYALKAVQGGAACLLLDHALDVTAPQLIVSDTLAALQKWGQTRLSEHRPKFVFGVTGSVGKTSTKEMLAAATSAWKTPGNRNNTLGLPAALATLPDGLEAAVLEMGMSTPGEIKRLTEIAPIDFGVIANIGSAHLENFPEGQKGIAKAKGEIIAGIRHGGAWVYPANDTWCRWLAEGNGASDAHPVRAVPVGEGTGYFISSIKSLGCMGSSFSVVHPSGRLNAEIRLPGLHQAQNALLAISIALLAGFGEDEIVNGIASAQPQEGRGRLYRLVGGSWLLDESYNASQESILSCVKSLMELDGGEPVAVLGCIRELGAESASIHEATGLALKKEGISRLWAYGDFANDYAAGFGLGAKAYPDFESMEPELAALPTGSRILVKGSRHWKAERVVSNLLERLGVDEAEAGFRG